MAEETLNKRIGDYELVSHIGDGAQGKIFKARCVVDSNPHVKKDEFVALKIVRRFAGEDDKGEERFRREARNLLAVKHPNLVDYRESFTVRDELSADIFCLVMEFLEGEDFRTRLQSYPQGLPIEQVRTIFEQALAGLCYAREHGLIHRDIKPGNIFLLSSGVAKVIDFGVARKEDGTVTTTAGFKGTYDYMAPDFITTGEDFRGDEQSDIFSLGVCFYQALTGRLPYTTSKESGWVAYLNRWQKTRPQDLSISTGPLRVLNDWATAVVRKSLRVDRRERYASFKEMLEDIRKIERRTVSLEKDRYEFQSYMGKGGFGEVFKAQRVRDGKTYAVKHLFPDLDPSRFVREARLLHECPHANLVEYAGFTKVQRLDGEDYYLVMEFLEGMPAWGLRARIKEEGALNLKEILHLFTGYLEGLHHLHTVKRKPILHRDITPANLYAPPYDPQKTEQTPPKIFDLGIARSEQTLTGGHVPGNPEYMAPEFVLEPDFRGSVQSDIYCVGMCLYEAVTGRPAYPRLSRETAEMWGALRDRAQGKHAIGFDHDAFRENPTMEKIVRKAIIRDPRKRFGSATEMLAALRALGTPDEGRNLAVEEPAEAGAESATVFVPDGEAAAAAVGRALPRRTPVWPRIVVIGGVAALALGLATVMLRMKGCQSAAGQAGEFLRKSGAFEPTASYVAALRGHIEKAGELKESHPGDPELARKIDQLNVLWAAMALKFDGAFQDALDKGDRSQARDIFAQWEKSARSVPFGSVTLSEHSSHAMSMKRRLEFVEEYAPFVSKEPAATQEYVEKLVSLLRRSEESIRTEVIPEAKPWWTRHRDTLAMNLHSFPGVFRQAFETALKNEKLVEAEAMIVVWKAAAGMAEVTQGIPQDARDRLSNDLAKLVLGMVTAKKDLVLAAYAGGTVKDADGVENWLRKCREEAPSLMAMAGERLDAAIEEITSAQVRRVSALVEAAPVPVSEADMEKTRAKLAEAESLYLKWKMRWSVADANKVKGLAAAKCNQTADGFAREALRFYGVSDYAKGEIAYNLLKKFVKIVPNSFEEDALDQKVTDVSRAFDESKKQDKEYEAGLKELDKLSRAMEKDDMTAWRDALEKWGGVPMQPKTREQLKGSEKWQNLTKVVELKLIRHITEAPDVRQLGDAKGILGTKEMKDLLGREMAERLLERVGTRESVLQDRARLDGILTATRPDDPLSWRRAIEELAATRSLNTLAHDRLAWEMWEKARQDCFDKIKDYVYKKGTDQAQLERLVKAQDVLKAARAANIFDPSAMQALEEYAGREKARLMATFGADLTKATPEKPVIPDKPVPLEKPVPPEKPAKPAVPEKPATPTMQAGMVVVDTLLAERKLREAEAAMCGEMLEGCRRQARKDPKAVDWRSLLAWVQRKRGDNPGLNLVGREDLNAMEAEIKRYADGAPVPDEDAHKKKETRPSPISAKTSSSEKTGDEKVKPSQIVKSSPPSSRQDPEMSDALEREVGYVEKMLKNSDYKEIVAYMSGNLVKRCRKIEKEDPAAMNWPALLQWVREFRKDHPGLNTTGRKQLDSLEASLQEAAGRKRKGE